MILHGVGLDCVEADNGTDPTLCPAENASDGKIPAFFMKEISASPTGRASDQINSVALLGVVVGGTEVPGQQLSDTHKDQILRVFGEPFPESDHSDIAREEREYVRRINILADLWLLAGPGRMG